MTSATTDIARLRRLIQAFDFDGLFEELGWDRFNRTLGVVVDGSEYKLTAVREKRGFQVYHYLVPEDAKFPSAAIMTKVQRAVAKTAHENLVIFSDANQSRQCFRIARREEGKLLRSTGIDFHAGHAGEALAQRISRLAFSLDEEEDVTLLDVTKRNSELFAEKVTKKFYSKFQQQRETFKDFIKGIQDVQQQDWYASLMLNRLMFVYFVQKKGFLDRDLDYLKNRLAKSRAANKDFHSFYRYFLLRLFHDGLNKRADARDPELEELLGEVPYLNGGIFGEHELEQLHRDIDIPDEAFEGLFEFFDGYQWHLDNRELRSDQEINPDVLGYIFEKYINQKQMGAYYTKEDITEYISKNTILPYLFDEARRRDEDPFRPDREVWGLLRDDPDRYIYDAVGHGIFVDIHTQRELDGPVPIPPNIAAGLDDVSQRGDWNTAAPPEVALPTETWREHIARRERCLELRRKLADGEVTQINDLVTLNLDIRQFAQDVIDNCESAELLRKIYYTIAGRQEKVGSSHKPQLPLSVLDPTCGSGAFLFAALNILQPLYEACLTKMQQFIDDADQTQPMISVDDEIEALIKLGESKTIEFKSTARLDVKTAAAIQDQPEGKQLEILKKRDKERQHDILKAVSALLNTDGGDLVIGVDDDGNGVGVDKDYIFLGSEQKRNRDNYELWLMDGFFVKHFGKVAAGCIEPVFGRRDGHDVVWLKITPSPDPVMVKKDDGSEVFYRRIGNASQSLSMNEFAKYRDQRFKGDPPARREPKLGLAGSEKKRTKKLTDFREILADVQQHPNRTYFVLKSIIINNLFGVDIMPEAVEICKLRLFLQLMSTVEPHYAKANLGVESLPDIDFNIRAGNTLVGYTSLAEIERSLSGTLGFEQDQLKQLQKQTKIVALQFELFRRQQTQLEGDVAEEDKTALSHELQTLTEELDEFLVTDYEIEARHTRKLANWKLSHRPFHWFAEFYAIMSAGGFSAVVGNPPWKEYSAVKQDYTVRGYATERCGNLHGICTERALALKSPTGHASFIVQLPIVCSSRMSTVRSSLRAKSGKLSVVSFDDRPGKLFDGLQHCRSAIWFSAGSPSHSGIEQSSTRYQRWHSETRDFLFPKIEFATGVHGTVFPELIPKYDQALHAQVFDLVSSVSRKSIADAMSPSSRKHFCFYQEATQYWTKAVFGLPYYAKNGVVGAPAHGRYVYSFDADTAYIITAILNSSLFYSYFVAYSDCFHLSQKLVEKFPITSSILDDEALVGLSKDLMSDLVKHSEQKKIRTRSGDEIAYAEFVAAKSKHIIDQIDIRLADHYGFDGPQREFILNYDIKYRMGSQND